MLHTEQQSSQGTQNTTSNTSYCYFDHYWYPNYPRFLEPYPWYPHYVPYYPPVIQPIIQPIIQPVIQPQQGFISLTDQKNYVFLNYVDKNPEVYITKNKNRVKDYGYKAGDNKVYLKNGDEFEFEIFNPSTSTLGIKIEMNGQFISDRHLIIKPGQRMRLDRYIETAKKFKFETYEVENTKEAKEAVAKNGDIKLYFYLQNRTMDPTLEDKLSKSFDAINCLYSNGLPGTTGPIGTMGTHGYNSTNNQSIGTTTTSYCSTTQQNFNLNDYIINPNTGTAPIENIETGRIEMGGKSDQEFKSVTMDFHNFHVFMTTFKILPLSQKPFEAKDLIRKCSNCETKLDRKDKYCSSCGHKAD